MSTSKANYEELVPHNAVKLIATNSTGDVLKYVPPYKVAIRKIVADVTGTEATSLVLALDKRPTAGSDTSRGAADLGSLTFAASNLQGKQVVDTPSSLLTLTPGEEAVLEVTTASSSDKAVVITLLVDKISEVDANLSDRSESA